MLSSISPSFEITVGATKLAFEIFKHLIRDGKGFSINSISGFKTQKYFEFIFPKAALWLEP